MPSVNARRPVWQPLCNSFCVSHVVAAGKLVGSLMGWLVGTYKHTASAMLLGGWKRGVVGQRAVRCDRSACKSVGPTCACLKAGAGGAPAPIARGAAPKSRAAGWCAGRYGKKHVGWYEHYWQVSWLWSRPRVAAGCPAASPGTGGPGPAAACTHRHMGRRGACCADGVKRSAHYYLPLSRRTPSSQTPSLPQSGCRWSPQPAQCARPRRPPPVQGPWHHQWCPAPAGC